MRYLASVQMAVKDVCGDGTLARVRDEFVNVSVGQYNIYINDWGGSGGREILITVYKLGRTEITPLKEFPCSLANLREQLTLAYHGCLLEAF